MYTHPIKYYEFILLCLYHIVIDKLCFLLDQILILKRKTVHYVKIKDRIVMIIFLLMSIMMKVIAKGVNILVKIKSK